MQVRCQHKNKECEKVDLSSSVGEIDDTEQEEFQPKKKMLRSLCSETTSSEVKSQIRTSCALMYYCKREKLYFTESVSLLSFKVGYFLKSIAKLFH